MSDMETNTVDATVEANMAASITAASASIATEAAIGTSSALKNDSNDDFGNFSSLPIGHLICSPIIEVANGQAELCKVYLDNLFRIAFKDDGHGGRKVNSITFTLPRVIVSPEGDVEQIDMQVEAPLLSLIPVPAFTMDEATVRFSMEIKDVVSSKDTSSSEVTTDAGFPNGAFMPTLQEKSQPLGKTPALPTKPLNMKYMQELSSMNLQRAWQS